MAEVVRSHLVDLKSAVYRLEQGLFFNWHIAECRSLIDLQTQYKSYQDDMSRKRMRSLDFSVCELSALG